MVGVYHCVTVGCTRSFASDAARQMHCVDKDHGEYESTSSHCKICVKDFPTSGQLQTHKRQEHNWCFICSRDFPSALALQHHNASIVHVNRHISCRVAGCDKQFKTPSGAAHHLESHTHEHIHRHAVTAVAQTMEIIPSISLNKRIAGDTATMTPQTSYVATAASWNGTHFECFLCKRGFKDLGSLNLHLNSAAHDVDEFRCPNEKCGRQFTLISGFVQHLESKACKLADLRQIQGRFDDLAAQFDRLLDLGERTGAAGLQPGPPE